MLTASLRRLSSRKRIIALALFALALVGLGLYFVLRPSDEDLQEVLKRGILIVCLDPSYPPSGN